MITMKKYSKNQSGSAVIVLVVLVVLVGVAAVGWRVSSGRNKPAVTTNTPSQPKTQTEPVLKPADILNSYTLPEDWKGIECQPGNITLLVPSQNSKTCDDEPISNPQDAKSPDFAYMGVVQRDIKTFDTQSCANTLQMRENSNSAYPANEYACSDVQTTGKKGIREVGTHTTQSSQDYGIPSVKITYVFPAGSGMVLEIAYIHYSQSPYPNLTKDFDSFVKSLVFK